MTNSKDSITTLQMANGSVACRRVFAAANPGTVSESGIGNGTTYEVEATPNEGYSFKYWTYDEGGDDNNPTYITIYKNTTLSAIFEEDPEYTLTVKAQPPQYGTVAAPVKKKKNKYTVSATPKDGFYFSRWSDNLEQEHDVTLTANTELTAFFGESGDGDIFVNPDPGIYIYKIPTGAYLMTAIGAGGPGGRTNYGEYFIFGTAGGGSGACVSALMNLSAKYDNELISVRVTVGDMIEGSGSPHYKGGRGLPTVVDQMSYNNRGKLQYKSIVRANGGQEMTYGAYTVKGGAGGTAIINSQLKLAGRTFCGQNGGQSWGGRYGNGGKYSCGEYKYGGGQISGMGYLKNGKDSSGRLWNLGVGYPPAHGYARLERYTKVVFQGEGLTKSTTKYYKRTDHIAKKNIPTPGTVEGKSFKGWQVSDSIGTSYPGLYTTDELTGIPLVDGNMKSMNISCDTVFS